MPKNHLFLLSFFLLVSVGMVYAAQTVTDRIEIDDDNIAADITADDLFGYQIEPIGDLDSDSVTDLAVIKFEADLVNLSNDDFGSILILFMNSDGSVKGTNEIVMDATAAGIGASCIVGDGTNRGDKSLEQLAFVGDLDGDGKPTLALGASSNDHGVADTGAVYMLELNTNGTVDNCVRIIPGENGFNPGNDVYNETTDPVDTNAALGWPLIATDLNGDGQNELIVGADSENDNFANLWVLFLTTEGAVSSHPAIPIKGETDIGTDTGDYMDDGISINGGTKIAVSAQNGATGEGSIFIINLTSAGAFVSSTEITGISLNQGITATDNFGSGLAPLGDMDADGVYDILVGNELGDDTNADSGEAYILYMRSDNTVKESQKISNESENTRTGTTPLAGGDLFGHGMAVWQGGPNTVIAISATQDDTGGAKAGAIHLFYVTRAPNPGGNGCGGDCIHPTIGLDNNGHRLVDDGFSYNGNTIDAILFHTPFPLITANIGQTNTVTVKVYDNLGPQGIKLIQLGLGVPEIGSSLNDAEVIVEAWLSGDDINVDQIKITDKHNLIENSSVAVSTEIVDCREDSTEQCVELTMDYVYREAPIYNIVSIEVMDVNRHVQSTTFNDGVQVLGKSMNPADVLNIVPSTTQNYPQTSGLVELIQIDRVEQLWIDPYGYLWKGDDSKIILISDILFERFIDSDDLVMTRLNSNFEELQKINIETAKAVFDSSKIQNKMPDYIQTQYVNTIFADRLEKLEPAIYKATQNALSVFDADTVYADKFTKKPIPENEDRHIFEILADELVQNKKQMVDIGPEIEVKHRNGLLEINGIIPDTTENTPLIVKIIYDKKTRVLELPLYDDGSFEITIFSEKYKDLMLYYDDVLLW